MKMNQSNQLDALDRHLLSLLQENCQLSVQQLAERTGSSGATCHRRVKAMEEAGYIERRVALLSHDRLKAAGVSVLHALVEVTLEPQTQENMARFEAASLAEPAVQQCWRTGSGPDFMLVLAVQDMPHYQQVAQRLFVQAHCVRNVRAFFATHRPKFSHALPLQAPQGTTH
ncbi:Lrp/AsnC family transcriptional regulator [Aquabacterium lacunae]|nr:Lrp/AsnC family transcriptional regulator [Aquabacterium lacunae]